MINHAIESKCGVVPFAPETKINVFEVTARAN